MRINSVSTISQPRIYNNKQTPTFQAKQLTLQKAETFLPALGFKDKLRLIFIDSKSDLIKEIMNQDSIMKLLKILPSEREEIFDLLRANSLNNISSYKKALYSLTQGNIPRKNAKDFILNRLNASFDMEHNFIPARFNLFNNLYDSCPQDNDFDSLYIRSIVKHVSMGRNIDKGKSDFALKWIGQKGCYDVANSVQFYTDADELYEHGLPEFTNFLQMINSGYAPSDRQMNAFKYMYPRMPKDSEMKTLCSIINRCTRYKDASENLLDFAIENFEDENLNLYLSFGLANDESEIDEIKMKRVKRLIQTGMNEYDSLYFTFRDMKNYNNFEEPWELLAELNERLDTDNAGYKTAIVQNVTNSKGHVNRESLEKLLRVHGIALKSKEILRLGNEDLTNEDIDRLIFDNVSKTLNTLNLLGEKTFVYSFKNKIDEVEYYIEDLFGDADSDFEPLLKVINPTESNQYQCIEIFIKDLKSRFKNLSGVEKENCIHEINSLTKERNELVKNSIHDPKDALDLAIIYVGLYDTNSALADKIIPYMNPKTDEEKQNFYNILNGMVLDSMEIEKEFSQKVLNKIDFSRSRYLPQIFNSDADFSEVFEKLLDILEKAPKQSNLNIFNSLPQNKETRVMFDKLGINYKKWTTFNPDSKIRISVNLNADNAQQSAIRNLEEDLTGQLFMSLPINQREKLMDKLKEHGFVLKSVRRTLHDYLGYVKETIFVQKFFKDDEMIDIAGAKQIISLIKEDMNSDEFWTRTYPDSRVQSTKETFKDHILKLRYNEVKNILDVKSDQNLDIVVQKADMNDIQHALFMGNDAGCCTAVDSCNGYSAVTYIMNKLISAIEIKDGDRAVGNTMCYFAYVDGEPALVLDNIEMKSKYQYNDKIRDAIFDYAKKLCAEVGKPDLPIYLGPNRHKVNLYNQELKQHDLKIIGSTGTDLIYLDFDADGHCIDGKTTYETTMYKIR